MRTTPARRAHVAMCTLAAATLLAGCGSGDDPTLSGDGVATSSTASSPTTAASASASTSAPAPTSTPPTSAPAGRVIEVRLEKGQVMGGVKRETVSVGDEVRIVATSDVADELHVHTYDLRTRLTPGTPGEIRFKAEIPGRHEVEFEKAHKAALTLEVR